jgi:type IV pilus modification protein PilV
MGFTLIEVLIAIVILSISLLALAALMATTTRNTSFGGHLTEAATFAQDQLERLKATSYDDIKDNWHDPSGSNTRTVSGIDYTRALNVVENGNLKTVTITVSWTDPTNVIAPHSFNIVSVYLK